MHNMRYIIAINIHKIYKYIFYIIGGVFAAGVFMPTASLGQFLEAEFPYEIQWQEYTWGTDQEINIATIVKEDTQSQTSLLQRLSDYFRVSGTEYNPDGTPVTDPATRYVKRILNMLLWLVSFLSLVMIIFAFYLIFFSKGEEAVGKAKKILIGVGVALAIMGLSWFIASFFFDIYKTVT